MDNYMKVEFSAKSCNESFARVAVAAFLSQMDPTLEELSDIKTALSEAVTNAIIHGYENIENGIVYIECEIDNDCFFVTVSDKGKGIENVEQAMQPLYTSHPEMERSGMGFTVMETFMDSVEVITKLGEGTDVKMSKTVRRK